MSTPYLSNASSSSATSLGRCFGVFGHPVKHSRSPAMHSAAFASLGLPHRYLAFDVAPTRLRECLESARNLGFGGVNLTVPHKQAAIDIMDDLSPAVRAIGAMNTVVFSGDKMIGHNTDGSGFWAGVTELGCTSPETVTVLGAGGAAIGVVATLLEQPSVKRVQWVCRDPAKISMASDRIEPCTYESLGGQLRADLVIDSTTVGMPGGPRNYPVELSLTAASPDCCVVDLVYTPAGTSAEPFRTPLLRAADEQNLRSQDGSAMLLWQGVHALELWLDRRIDQNTVELMRPTLS